MAIVAQPGRTQLRRLAQWVAEDGCVLSVYVDLDPREFATAPARASALTSAADEASRAIEADGRELSRDTRLGLREDVERIRSYAAGADFDGTHGLAIFTAAAAGLFEVLHLPRPVPNAVRVDRSPYVTPIAGEPNGSWCVALVNRRDARLLRGGPLRLSEVERIDDDVPGQHDQGGWSQARFERHIDEQARQHLRRVGRRLEQLRRDGAYDHLLLGAPEAAYAELVELLDGETRALARGRVSVDVDSVTEAEATEAAAPLMRAFEDRRREELLDRVEEGMAPDGHAAAGLDEVVRCLNEQRVATVLFDGALAAKGASCPGCGWLTADPDGTCPADGSALREADLVEAVVERALFQDAEVLRDRDDARLAGHGGIAALLRF